MRACLALAAVLGQLTALPAAPLPEPLPPAIAEHVINGRFDPGDYGWLRGAFPPATLAEAAQWQAIRSYRDQCRGHPPAAARAKLAALGYHPPDAYWQVYATGICEDVQTASRTLDGFDNWEEYKTALAQALVAYRTFVFAVRQAEAFAPIDRGSLRDRDSRSDAAECDPVGTGRGERRAAAR